MTRIFIYIAIIALQLAFAGLVVAQETTSSREVNAELGGAYARMQSGDNSAALEILDELIESRGDELTPFELASALELRGAAKFAQGDYEGARADFQTALDLDALPEERQGQLQQYIEMIENGAIGENSAHDNKILPNVRIPAVFPEKCVKNKTGDFEAYVDFEYDIIEDGSVDNIRVIDTNDECFVDAARNSLARWKYEPPIENGKPARREDVSVRITFRYEH